MSSRISDVGRFKEIVRNKVKHNLGKFISSENIIAGSPDKPIKIPLNYIDLPRFSFGSNSGGVGQGEGDEGDPMGNSKKPGKGKKAGEDSAEHDFSSEFEPEELAEMIREHLELPRLEPKSKGKTSSTSNSYNGISNVGNEGLKHFKRTYKQALKRDIASGTYDPRDPKIIPIKSDKRYKSASPTTTPDINCVCIFIADCSGSMGQEEKHIVKSMAFWTKLLLKQSYADIENVFIIHDTTAQEVDEKSFFSISTAGGTQISSAYELCLSTIKKKFPFSENNIYIFNYSDGDNFYSDNDKAISLLKNELLQNCNQFCYGQIRNDGSYGFYKDIAENIKDEKCVISTIKSNEDILAGIKSFFENAR